MADETKPQTPIDPKELLRAAATTAFERMFREAIGSGCAHQHTVVHGDRLEALQRGFSVVLAKTKEMLDAQAVLLEETRELRGVQADAVRAFNAMTDAWRELTVELREGAKAQRQAIEGQRELIQAVRESGMVRPTTH